MSLKKLALYITALAVLPLSDVQAQDDEALLVYRQKLMQAVGANKGAIDQIVKNELPLKANIAGHARALQQTALQIEGAFEKKVTQGRTDSQPAIWQEWDKYVAAAKKMASTSAALAKAAESGDDVAINAALQEVGGSCGACHKPYRKPKEERFER